MINYGIVYGLSDYGLADRLNIPREEAKAFIDAYLARFAKVAEFMASTIEQAGEQGYVTTLFGRRRQIPELRARNWQVRSLGERLAVNTVIQGTAADVLKLAMIGAAPRAARAGMRARLILTVHDELLLEAPEDEADAVKRAGRARDGRAVGAARAAARRRGRRRARPGWRRSSGSRRRGRPDRVRRRADRAAGADQLDARQGGRQLPGGVRVVRDRDRRARRDRRAGQGRASARSARRGRSTGTT